VKDGAALYVCGDATAMAKDVHDTLVRILGKAELDAIRRDGRYARDVW
jgi:sulfite reductase (NADPH) flavoprotein alpha-component